MENISDLLRCISAPRHNTVWSWGSVRKVDGTVFLLVWVDETKKQDGTMYTQILGPWGDGAGYRERVEHVELIKKGAPVYLIFCTAKDTKANPRKISGFNKQTLLRVGRSMWMVSSRGLKTRNVLLSARHASDSTHPRCR